MTAPSEQTPVPARRFEVTILGCGSSGGVPRANGEWGACDPGDPRNRRTRCSMLLRAGPEGEGPLHDANSTVVLVDVSPDLRVQALAAALTRIDAVLITHDHADQTHGIDDLRVFAGRARRRCPVRMDRVTLETLVARFDYIFAGQHGYPAIADALVLPPHGEPWSVSGPGGLAPVVTFDQAHGPIRSVGYRFGPIAYSSDVSDIDDETLDSLQNLKLWIVDALRWTPHPTHAHVDKALGWIARVRPERAVLTNLHIDLDFAELAKALPTGVEPAYDGWSTVISG